MGNKSSSPGGQGPKVNQAVAGIIQEGPPPGRDHRPSGSLPDLRKSGPVSLDPRPLNNQMDFSRNFSMKVQDSGQIGGKPAGGKSRHPNNPVLAEEHYHSIEHGQGTDLALPRGFPDYGGPGQFDVYWKSLDQVTSIWPEYDPIRDIDVKSLRSPVRQTLQQILKRLSEQHDLIRKLSVEQHEGRQEMAELKEEHEAVQQILRKREHENRSLKEDVFILRSELKKYRSAEPRLPRSKPDGQDSPDHHAAHTPDHSRRILSESAVPGSDHYQKDNVQNHGGANEIFERRKRDGIFKATPLLVAEGGQAESRRAVQRTHSLKPTQGDSPRHHYRDGNAPISDHSDLKDKLWRTEIALEKERKDNETLREKFNARDTDATVSIPSLKPKKKKVPTATLR